MAIRSEALPYLLPPAALAAAALALDAPFFAAGAALLAAGLALFFRDPFRSSDAPEDAVLSPADGIVKAVESTARGLEIAIFLSLWNVHVTRSPVEGVLVSCTRYAGGYEPAYRATASSNARCALRVDTVAGNVEVSLIAGAVARRVHLWVTPQQQLARGERIALIRFGSRAELRLPRGVEPAVRVGDRVRAGETIVARKLVS